MNYTRIAVVGCGFYAQNHLNAWNDLKDKGAKLVSVCDLDHKKAKVAGEKFGVPFYTNIDEMLDNQNIHLLDIVTQMHSHQNLAAIAAERQLACIVQKPFAPTLEKCVSIVEKSERHKSWLAVHENFRFSTVMSRVKKELNSGVIGFPNWARITFRTSYDIYSGQPYLLTEERLAILDTGIHVLDLARFFMGEVEHIACETQRRNPKVKGDDTATMLLKHKSGAVSVVETTYDSKRIPDPFPATLLEIEGMKGSIMLSHEDNMTVTSGGKVKTLNIGSQLLPWTSRPWHGSQEAVLNTNAHFLQTFRDNKPADTSGRDNLKTFSLVEAAYLSAEKNIMVKPKFS